MRILFLFCFLILSQNLWSEQRLFRETLPYQDSRISGFELVPKEGFIPEKPAVEETGGLLPTAYGNARILLDPPYIELSLSLNCQEAQTSCRSFLPPFWILQSSEGQFEFESGSNGVWVELGAQPIRLILRQPFHGESRDLVLPQAAHLKLEWEEGEYELATLQNQRLPKKIGLAEPASLKVRPIKQEVEALPAFPAPPEHEVSVKPSWYLEVRSSGINLGAVWTVSTLREGLTSLKLPSIPNSVLRKVQTIPASRVEISGDRLVFARPQPNPFTLRLDWGLPLSDQMESLSLPVPKEGKIERGTLFMKMAAGFHLRSSLGNFAEVSIKDHEEWPRSFLIEPDLREVQLDFERLALFRQDPLILEYADIQTLWVGGGRVATQLRLQILPQTRETLRLPVPEGSELKGVFLNDRSLKAFMEDNQVLLPFQAEPNQSYEVEIQLEMQFEDARRFSLSLPEIYGLAPGTWKVRWPEGYRVENMNSTLPMVLPGEGRGTLHSYHDTAGNLRSVLLWIGFLAFLLGGFYLALRLGYWLLKFSIRSVAKAWESLQELELGRKLSWLWGLILILAIPGVGAILFMSLGQEATYYLPELKKEISQAMTVPQASPEPFGGSYQDELNEGLMAESDDYAESPAFYNSRAESSPGSAMANRAGRQQRERSFFKSGRAADAEFAMQSLVASPPPPPAPKYARKGSVKAVRQQMPELADGIIMNFSERAGEPLYMEFDLKPDIAAWVLNLRFAILGLLAASLMAVLLYRLNPLPWALASMGFLWWSTTSMAMEVSQVHFAALALIALLGAVLFRFRACALLVALAFVGKVPDLHAQAIPTVYEVWDREKEIYRYENFWLVEKAHKNLQVLQEDGRVLFASQEIRLEEIEGTRLRVQYVLKGRGSRSGTLMVLPNSASLIALKGRKDSLPFELLDHPEGKSLKVTDVSETELNLWLEFTLQGRSLARTTMLPLAISPKTAVWGNQHTIYFGEGLKEEGKWLLPYLSEGKTLLTLPSPGFIPSRQITVTRQKSEPRLICRLRPGTADFRLSLRQNCLVEGVSGLKFRASSQDLFLKKVELRQGRRVLVAGQDYGLSRSGGDFAIYWSADETQRELELEYELSEAMKRLPLLVSPAPEAPMNLKLERDSMGGLKIEPEAGLRSYQKYTGSDELVEISSEEHGFLVEYTRLRSVPTQGSRLLSVDAQLHHAGQYIFGNWNLHIESRGDNLLEFSLPEGLELIRAQSTGELLEVYQTTKAQTLQTTLPRQPRQRSLTVELQLRQRLEGYQSSILLMPDLMAGAYSTTIGLHSRSLQPSGFQRQTEIFWQLKRVGMPNDPIRLKEEARSLGVEKKSYPVQGLRLQLFYIGLCALALALFGNRLLVHIAVGIGVLVLVMLAQPAAIFVLPLFLASLLKSPSGEGPAV